MRYEQAVYGSFPFWDRGYAVLAHSPGCEPAWLDAFRATCQKFGEPSRGASSPLPGAMFGLRLSCERRPWLVVGVSTPGTDDHGRPNALAFHGVFVEDHEFRKAGYNPFAIANLLRHDWNAETQLVAGTCEPVPLPDPLNRSGLGSLQPQTATGEVAAIAATLARGKRVALESASPIEELAREVWDALPVRVRRRSSVATWAFANGVRFDLLASPRLDTLNLDASYVSPATSMRADSRPRRMRLRPYAILSASVLLMGIAASFAYRVWTSPPATSEPANVPQPAPRASSPPLTIASRPDPSSYRQSTEDPDESRAVERGLATFGKRFLRLESDDAQGPTAWMVAVAAMRYHGPLLSAEDVAKIKSDASPGSARALSCDAHIRKFAPDRTLPSGFASGPLRWQLDTLAWSFHLDLDPKLTPAEIPIALAEALAREEPIEPNPLEAEYPALEDYARFLETLPRRE